MNETPIPTTTPTATTAESVPTVAPVRRKRRGAQERRYRHDRSWGYVKRRKKPSFSPPGPAPSGVPPLEQKRIRGARYRDRLAARGLVDLHILVGPEAAARFRALAAERGLSRGQLLAELIPQAGATVAPGSCESV